MSKATQRNWLKGRLMGFHIDTSLLHPSEISFAQQIEANINNLLSAWDSNSYNISGKPMPTYKCEFCGKRTWVRNPSPYGFLCNKHNKEYVDG